MKLTMLLMAVAGALTVTGVQAQEMLKSKGCLACHDVDKKKMGPSLKDIAAKYKADKAIVDVYVLNRGSNDGPKVVLIEASCYRPMTSDLRKC
jgi:cytochrome c551/c552